MEILLLSVLFSPFVFLFHNLINTPLIRVHVSGCTADF